MTDIRCPMCAHMNSEGSLHCEKCDARLVPMGDIGKALNIPPDSQPEEDDLSAFLEKIVDDGGQDASIDDGLDEDVLSWLDDEHPEKTDDVLLEALTSDEEPGQEPDFSSLVEEEIDEKAITNWLSKASDEEDETDESPDWMTLVVSQPDEDLSEVESWFGEPDEASFEDQVVQKETTDDELFTAPLPDWLDEQAEEALAAVDIETTDFTAQLPDWMDAIGDEEAETFGTGDSVEEEGESIEVEEPQFTAQLPDWMTEVDEVAEEVAPETFPEEELPEWFTQELDEEALEQLEPPVAEDAQEEIGSQPLPVPKVSTGALPWMGGEPMGDEPTEETRQEEFELPTATTQKPDQVEKPPRVQTGALPWVSNAREGDEWVASDESEDISEEFFAPELDITEPASEQAPAEEPIVAPSAPMLADDEFATPLDEFIVEDESQAYESLSSDEEKTESVSFEDVMSEEESFFKEESPSMKPEDEAPMAEATEVEAVADVAKSWSKFLETADKLGAEEELPEWFAKTGGGKPSQPVEQDESVLAEESDDIVLDELDGEKPEKAEPPTKKRGTTWTLLFGRRKKKEEQQRLEATETTSEPVTEPEPDVEPVINEPEPAVAEDEATAEPAREGEWDLSTILSDSQPLASEPDEESIVETIKGDLTDSAWLVDESGKPLVEEIDDDQAEGDTEKPEPEAKPGLTMPPEEVQKAVEMPADGMSSLDRLTAALGLGEEEDTEELVDEGLIGFAGTTELPAWMMGDVDQEAEATAMLDAALGETKIQPEAMTAGLPDWLEEAAEEMEEEEEEEEEILFPEPEDELMFGETGEVDEVISTAELPAWLAEEETEGDTEEEDDLITSVSGELADSQYTDWLTEFAVEDEFEDIPDITDEVEEEGTAVLPDWLLDKDQETETPDEVIEDLFPATSALTGSTAGLPDWLSTYADDEEEAEEETIAEVTPIEMIQEPDDLDDWLIKSDEQEEQPLVVSDTDELNEWVQEHGIQFPAMDEDEEPLDDEVIPVDVRKDLPDWVFELEPEDEGEPIPELNGAGTAELPAWLVAGDESPDMAESHPDEVVAEEEFFDFMAPDDSIAATTVFTLDDEFDEEFVEEDDDLRSLIISESTYAPTVELDSQSEWLSSYAEEETSGETSFDDEEVHEVEEIPEWVQLADTSSEWEEGVETFGAALKFDTFEEETIKEIPNEERNIQLMERILLSEKKAVPVPRTRQRNRQLTLRLTITLLMIALVAVGLYYLPIPQPNFIANAPIQVVQFYQQMQYFQQTAPDKPVLVVFDLQPAYEGELSVYAELPLKALMENDTRIFTFSTVPEGAALAQKMMVDVVMANNLVYNTQSQAMNLGYLPGGAAAIRDFALNMRFTVHGLDVGVNGVYIWEHPNTSDIDSLDDFAMVIVMTDDLDKARLWIEQSSLYLPASTPLLMVSSAKVTPLLKPYLLSGQLGGLIGNPIDAAAYATLSNETSKVIYFWKAYELGIYLMMASVFGGAVYLIVKQLRKEKNGTIRGGGR